MLTSARNFISNNTHGIIPSLNVLLNNYARTTLEIRVAFKFASSCYKINETIGHPLGLALGCILGCNLLDSNAYAFITKAGADSVKNGFTARGNLYNTSLSTWLASNVLTAGIGLATCAATAKITNFMFKKLTSDITNLSTDQKETLDKTTSDLSDLLGFTVATFAKSIISRSETFQNIVS